MSKIFFIMGKSASGKDGIFTRLLQQNIPGLKPVVLYTTRPMREGEEQGREYHFTDINGLNDMREKGLVIEERVYHTVQGDWIYFTAADEAFDGIGDESGSGQNLLVINTLEAYEKYLEYFGEKTMVPIYIYVDDDIRLIRAVERERQQKTPDYKEICRRFLADEDDFSEEKLMSLNVTSHYRFNNNTTMDDTVRRITEFIKREINHRLGTEI